MAERHTFDIYLPTQAVGGRVLIDGVEVRGVRRVVIDGPVGDLTHVTLTLLPHSVRVHGDTALLDITEVGDTSRRYAP